MKIKHNINIYQCEYCRKKYYRENHCEAHEHWCTMNPVNKNVCGGCDFLKETEITLYFDSPLGGEIERQSKSFYCLARDCGVYPMKAVKIGMLDNHPVEFENQIPMPRECSLAKYTLPF